MKNNKLIISLLVALILILISIIGGFIYNAKREEILENRRYFAQIDKNFYLQKGKLFIFDTDGNPMQVPGDFSQMDPSDYEQPNHQSKIGYGKIYFYYKLDNKLYLVMSADTGHNDWTTKDLTSEIGMPSDVKIKYIRIGGNYGYIFYINSDGVGKILKSTSQGAYWYELKTDFALNDECTLQFLNKYGLTADGFLTVPSEDGEKCDLYRINDSAEETFEKIDISEISDYDGNLDYYSMPTYLEDSEPVITVDVKENRNISDFTSFVSSDGGETWKTEKEYYKYVKEEREKNDEIISRFNQMVENLDPKVYLTDFENYNVSSNEVKISESKAKNIAKIGFQESASRIASEGIRDTENEFIEIREVSANNYFTRRYSEGDKVYTNITRNAYVVLKENSMGNGVMIYVDVTTGLIIGASAFGD